MEAKRERPESRSRYIRLFGRVEVMRQLHEGETKLERAEFARAVQEIFHYVLDKDHQTNGQISDEQILMSLFCR